MINPVKFKYYVSINGIIEIPNEESMREMLEEAFTRLASKLSLSNSSMSISLVFPDENSILKVETKHFDNK
jgi:hypothetical protein